MTEDAIRVTPGRPTTTGGAAATTGGAGPAAHRRRGLPVPSELIALVATILALLIAAAVTDDFDASLAWGFVTVLVAAYILSRGLTKRGTADDGL